MVINITVLMSIAKDCHRWEIVFRRNTYVTATNVKAADEFKRTKVRILF